MIRLRGERLAGSGSALLVCLTCVAGSARSTAAPASVPPAGDSSPVQHVVSTAARDDAESGPRPRRNLINARELIDEVRVAPGREALAARSFIRFDAFHDALMFHPKLGYYARGKVVIDSEANGDFGTFPEMLSPHFGQMLAEQVFHMWRGMVQAGTARPGGRFIVGEVGGGDGRLAYDFLSLVERRAERDRDWKTFRDGLAYVGYDRSSELLKQQRQRCAEFGVRFRTREVDARQLLRAIPEGSLTGVVLSNELLDVFPVTKNVLMPDGTIETCHVVPFLDVGVQGEGTAELPAGLRDFIRREDQKAASLLTAERAGQLRLTERSLGALLDFVGGLADERQQAMLDRLAFAELYLPAKHHPDLVAYLERNLEQISLGLAIRGKGAVIYSNLGAVDFAIQAGRALRAGYVVTVDYGESLERLLGTTGPSTSHLRTFPPPPGYQLGNPYRELFDVDVTADINFTDLARAGSAAALDVVFYGEQRGLVAGTSVDLDREKERRLAEGSGGIRFARHVDHFLGRQFSLFRLLVQKKRGTDSAYAFPEPAQLPLLLEAGSLDPELQAEAAVMERKFRESLGRKNPR